VRHGQSELNVLKLHSSDADPKYTLTTTGEKQAENAGAQIKILMDALDISEPNGIYTSPLPRTMETANIIAKDLGKTPIVNPLLKERYYGIMEGKPSDIPRGWKLEPDLYRLETFDAVKGRVRDFVEKLGSGFHVAVTHKDVIICAVGEITGEGEESLLDTPSSSGSITLIDYNSRKPIFIGQMEVPDEITSSN
jgi:alpha-ribazole phosphatase